jgi:hypothetical protein
MNKMLIPVLAAIGLLAQSTFAQYTFSASPTQQSVSAGSGTFSVTISLQTASGFNASAFDLYIATAAANSGLFTITGVVGQGVWTSTGPPSGFPDTLNAAAASGFVRNNVDLGFSATSNQAGPFTQAIEIIHFSYSGLVAGQNYVFSTTTSANAGAFYSDVSDRNGNVLEGAPGTFTLVLPGSAPASWKGGTGNWSTAADWNPATVPNNGADVTIDSGGTDNVTLDIKPTIATLVLGGATGSSTLQNKASTAETLTITGALTINPTGTLLFQNGSTLTVGSLANNGTMTIGGGARLTISNAGTLTNSGAINLGSDTAGATLQINGNVTFSGKGTMNLSNNSGNVISGTSGSVLTNASTIQGSGNIGNALISVVNSGTINANQSTALIIDTNSAGLTNNGTLSVSSGDSLHIEGGQLKNFNSGTSTLTGGKYLIGGTLQLANTTGRITTDAANITMTGANAKVLNSNGASMLTSLNTITSKGTFGLASGFNFTTAGNFTNNGTLSIGSGSKFTVNLANNLTNFNSSTHTLTGGTYAITGTLQFNNANIVTNAAKITLTGTSSKIIDQSSTNALANFATNNGSFTLAGNRSFTTAGNFANAGTLTINTGSTFSVGGSGMFTQSQGTFTDNGSLSVSGGLSLNGGTLGGKGSITGRLTSSSSATIDPGTSAKVTAALNETGAYTQNSGTLDIAIDGLTAGTKYDQFNPSTASLSGILNISRPTGFVPAIGSTFKIMNFNSETGTFGTVNGLAINSGEHFTVAYQPTDVLLTVVSGAMSPAQAAPDLSTRNVPDASSTWTLLLLGLAGTFGLRLVLRKA